jgi:hypothetical protein
MLSACVRHKSAPPLEIEVRAAEFVMHDRSYHTTAELTTALREMAPPQAINLVITADAGPNRKGAAVAAIKDAGITAPIGWVGNEVFH